MYYNDNLIFIIYTSQRPAILIGIQDGFVTFQDVNQVVTKVLASFLTLANATMDGPENYVPRQLAKCPVLAMANVLLQIHAPVRAVGMG